MISFSTRYYSALLSESIVYDIRNDVYVRLQDLSFSFYSKTDTGQIIARATSDVERIKGFISFTFRGFIGALIMLVSALMIMFYLDYVLTLMVLTIFPVILLIVRHFARRVKRLFEYSREIYGVFTGLIRETIIGIKIIKSFTAEERFSNKFAELNSNYRNSLISVGRMRAFVWPAIGFLVSLATLLVYWYGGLQVMAGKATIGDVVALSIYVGMITWPMVALGFFTVRYERAMVSAKRVFEILEAESDVKEDPNAIPLKVTRGEIIFDDVWFRYDDNGRWVLRGVSFRVRPGERVAIVGPTGSGKTTLIQLLPRFFDPQRGRILIDGIDIRKVKLDSLRRNIGIVHQDIYLFPDTIKNNIAYGKPKASMDEIIRVAKIARLHDFIMSLPRKYETVIGERGITLSGGQRQRLAIARTLITNPKIIILDDSTSNVDAETEKAIYDALSRFFKGKTVLIISHRLSTLRMADKIIVLREGRVAEEGTFEDLLKKSKFFRSIFKEELSASVRGEGHGLAFQTFS
ncbi:MAG: hypothetical protein B6U94_04975 [Thermofilum sp. ex4484_79]|nr:MAG: hypothetical protein B6U94_04975 [Thermofilum sp. ex4484_79]